MTAMKINNARLRLGATQAIDLVSAGFKSGEVTALVGPNGAGKSTLLRVLAGLVSLDTGTVEIGGEDIQRLDVRARARQIAYLPPDGRAAWPLPVRRIVALGRVPFLKPLRQLSDEDVAAIDDALARTGLSEFAERGFNTLSSGEQARALLARTLAGRAPVLLLDEPMAALDPRHQLEVMEIVRREAGRGACVILSVHALDLAAAYADRVLVLDNGAVHSDGPPEVALSEAVLRSVFGVIAKGGLEPSSLCLAEGAD